MKIFFFAIMCLFSQIVYSEELIFVTSKEKFLFETDIAKTPLEQEKGLMYKKSIPNNYAMTFIFKEPKIIYMWMKNTFIPLDMVFFDSNGQIIWLKENAQPHDETIISSQYKAKGVIEMNAGLIKDMQLSIGNNILIQSKNPNKHIN